MRKNRRMQLAADENLGVGNALDTVIALGERLDEPTLTFDTDVDGHPAWQPLTLRELGDAVARRAAALSARGITAREPVLVYVGSAADQVLSYLALTRIGAIPALLNPNVPAPTAAVYLDRIRPAALLTDADHRTLLGDAVPDRLPEIDVAVLGDADPADAAPQYRYHPDDAAVITHSSGTTGVPKAVVASHNSLFGGVRYRLTLPRGRWADRMLSALPTNHAAMVIAVNVALCNPNELLLLSEQSGPGVLRAADRWKPTSVLGFAATWPDLAAENLDEYDLSSIQVWWNTGDCAHEAHIRKLTSVGKRVVVTRGGMKELTGASFVDGLGSTEMGHSQFYITHTPETNRYKRCVGKPHSFADVAVLDEAGDELPVGEVGELGVRSSTLAHGYWNDSVTTYRTRRRGYFLTGDLMYRDVEGYYYHVDRAADSVDLGNGHRLYTAQSEERILAACPDILDCTVLAVREPDGLVSTQVMLVPHTGADHSIDRSERVRAALDEHVAATVRSVFTIDQKQIPHGPTGKVRKVVLRERYAKAGLAGVLPEVTAS